MNECGWLTPSQEFQGELLAVPLQAFQPKASLRTRRILTLIADCQSPTFSSAHLTGSSTVIPSLLSQRASAADLCPYRMPYAEHLLSAG